MKIGINLFLMLPHVGGVVNYVMTFLKEWPIYYPDASEIRQPGHGANRCELGLLDNNFDVPPSLVRVIQGG